ncbi:PRD domain-containing protein [Clostridium sp. OS1-26]|uniref:PRD domain-containing protein n=1 Tax=Clostridium sp. OS1-26 TaxID=3070681 RepID=UPI0027E214CC|nr:PRD domain-containing protein [Clostridium sp. OS1-26]WML34929.1 PRD domain-containing protein [Clostridium sp. OS1-26]
MDLGLRLNILKEGGQIDEGIYNNLIKTIEIFDKNFEIKLTEENGAMFVTHLSAALNRIKKNELVKPIEKEIFTEVEKDNNFKKANEILDLLEEIIKIYIPEVERTFILMHIVTILSK